MTTLIEQPSHSKTYIAINLAVIALFLLTQYSILDHLEGFWFFSYLVLLVIYLPFIVSAYIYWNFDMYKSRKIELRKWGEDTVVESETKDLTPLGQFFYKIVNFYIGNKISVLPSIIILNIWLIAIAIDILFGRKVGGADWKGGASLPEEDLRNEAD